MRSPNSNALPEPPKQSNLPAPIAERSLGYPRYGYSDFTDHARDDDAFDLRKYLNVIIKRWRLVLGIIGVFTLIGLIANFLMTPIYQATATLQIDREAANVVQIEGLQTTENLGDPQFYQTQYELLKSRALAEKTVSESRPGGR